jgi:hypothetical protein
MLIPDEPLAGATKKLEALRGVPRVQRRPLAKPLSDFERDYLVRREAMARAFLTAYSTQIDRLFHRKVITQTDLRQSLKQIPVQTTTYSGRERAWHQDAAVRVGSVV